MVDQTIRNIIVCSFSVEDFFSRSSFDKYDILFIEIKDFNVLIDSKSFFDQLAKKQTKSVWRTC